MGGLEQLMEFGLVGGSFLLMLFQSFKREEKASIREEKLMSFMMEMKNEMTKMSEAYIRLSEDVEDIRHRIENNKD